jgi:hypothetical protein
LQETPEEDGVRNINHTNTYKIHFSPWIKHKYCTTNWREWIALSFQNHTSCL